jgi:hypothetical protein
MERATRTDSGGLLEVKASARIRSRAYVQFMHESIRDYFYKSKTVGVFSISSRLGQTGHDNRQLANFCIGYFLKFLFLTTNHSRNGFLSPVAEYSSYDI